MPARPSAVRPACPSAPGETRPGRGPRPSAPAPPRRGGPSTRSTGTSSQRDAGALGDVLHLHVLVVAIGDELDDGVQQAAPGAAGSASSSRATGVTGWRLCSSVGADVREKLKCYSRFPEHDRGGPTMGSADHYTMISADCHAGGSHEMYREHLDPTYVADFDVWREKYKNPFRDLQDGGRIRNWDDDKRNHDLETDGIVAEVVFPNTVPPVLPQLHPLRPPAQPEEYAPPTGRHPGPQPVDGRVVRPLPRAPRRHRPDLPQRRRRGDEDVRWCHDNGLARRDPHLVHPAGRQLPRAALLTRATTRCGRCARARDPREQPRRHRHCPTTAATGPRRSCSSPR